MQHFTADTHFDHEKIIDKMARAGGYATLEEHNETLLEEINSRVDKRDQLRINGDFAFKRPQYWRGRIRCKNITFCIGNHDKPLASKSAFGTVHQHCIVRLDCGERAFLCHYPTAYWPSSHHGIYHFYGHCHDQRESTLDALFPDRRSMDVGVDVAYRLFGKHRPFTEPELMELLKDRKGHDQVEFYRELRGEV
jgi:calcineurin-like phosphoesterase family protein